MNPPCRHTEAVATDLVVVGSYRQTGCQLQLLPEAAAALHQMSARAGSENVGLVPISGFRTVAYQAMLFSRAVDRHGSEARAARWVVRPGYSERHSGLAVDLGDQDSPAADVEPAFEPTPAFAWLEPYASRFGFEMSYPRENPAGFAFEPSHWRFVGTPGARMIFEQ